jgi:hypothetical protein
MSPDGRALASAGNDATVRLSSVAEVPSAACSAARGAALLMEGVVASDKASHGIPDGFVKPDLLCVDTL